MYKILKYLAVVFGVIGAVLLVRVLMAGDDAITDQVDVQASVVDPFLWLSYIIMAVVIALVLFYVLRGLFKGDVKKTLMSVGAFLIVLVLAYILADDTIMYDRNNTAMITASGAKWVSTGLIAFYILGILAILAMVFSGVKKMTTR